MPSRGCYGNPEEGALGSPCRHAKMQESLGSWLALAVERGQFALRCAMTTKAGVLIVKDESLVALIVEDCLRDAGYDVVAIASDLQQATRNWVALGSALRLLRIESAYPCRVACSCQ